jgi:hypothetical protein
MIPLNFAGCQRQRKHCRKKFFRACAAEKKAAVRVHLLTVLSGEFKSPGERRKIFPADQLTADALVYYYTDTHDRTFRHF